MEHASRLAVAPDYRLFLAVNNLPNRCALDVAALADRIGADKLELIRWMRADVAFARLIASKVSDDTR
jgi:hypothetical protein